MTNSELLKQAEQLHQQGKLKEALQLYLEILKGNPKQADVAHLISILYAQMQEYDKAEVSNGLK